MKFVTLAAPVSQFDAVARTCVVNQQFHPESAMQVMHEVKNLRPFSLSNPYTAPLRRAEALAQRLHIQAEFREFQGKSFSVQGVEEHLTGLEERMEAMEHRREELENKAADDRGIVEQLRNLSGISADLGLLRSLNYLRFRFGHMPRETYDSFREAMNEREDLFFLPTRVESDVVYGAYFTTAQNHHAVDTLLNSLHFIRVNIDHRADGTVEEAIDTLTRDAQAAQAEHHKLLQQLSDLAREEQEPFLEMWSYLRYHNDTYDLRRYAAHSKDTFYLVGWVPQDELPAFLDRCARFDDLSYVVDEPVEVGGAVPPTKLKNGLLGRVFQPFLQMYGLPNYHEIDPSFFMALTYCLFAGIMFGDVGQGACLFLAGMALWRFKKMWLGRIIACCGVSSVIFGFVYGSVFGFEDILPGFKALEGSNVVVLLVASLGLGAAMIFLVMVLNIINGIRQHNPEKCLFGPNGLCGMVFYFGLVGAALSMVLGGPNLFVPAYVLPVLILPLVLMLLREPLGKLVAREPDWKPESLGGLLVTGFFELFETLLSYLTNTLSFMRVGAYAITHVGLMMVVQMLAGENLNPVVLIIGNLFVIGFEGMLVGIQVLRLEFYELFGRFYEDSGREYHPRLIDYSANK